MKYYIGIDLGGTNIKAGVVSEDFKIVAKASCKTNLPRPGEEICADMAKVALEAVKEAGLTLDDIEAVGIGTPGTANSEAGVIEYSNNLGFLNFPVVKLRTTLMPQHTANSLQVLQKAQTTLSASPSAQAWAAV